MAERLTAESAGYAVLSASANVWPKSVAMLGIFVSAASATPTITVYDSSTTTTTTPIVTVFTPVAGTYYKLPFQALNGLYVVISGTVSCTVGFQTETTQ